MLSRTASLESRIFSEPDVCAIFHSRPHHQAGGISRSVPPVSGGETARRPFQAGVDGAKPRRIRVKVCHMMPNGRSAQTLTLYFILCPDTGNSVRPCYLLLRRDTHAHL